ncbi:MAG: FAD synthetase family protein [Spirochaetales bacterium]|nr:FAD synthetase family protein [Spirochaetales bacterium]
MRIVSLEELGRGRDEIEKPPSALTIGVFDALHVGHQRLISAVVASPAGVMPVVCTFRQSPGSVLGTRRFPGNVLSFRQKMARLEGLGVEEVVLIDFSPEISKLTGKRFIELLAGYLTIRKLVVGYNFHMGRNRDTGVTQLRRMLQDSETELVVVPATFHGGRPVSSSRIRDTIREGDFSEVQLMIGAPFCLDLRDVEIEVRGSRAAVKREALDQILPRPGEYPARVRTQGAERTATVSVAEQTLSWTRDWQEHELEICFTQ